MITKSHFALLFISILAFLQSCKTYYIPVESFKQQFSGLKLSRNVTAIGPFGEHDIYYTYPIDSIRCVDKNGGKMLLKSGPAIQIRFTTNQNKETIFFFDRIEVYKDTVLGIRSRLIPSITRKIPLNDVKTIEVQDSKKKYRYL
jgi:hypothetical protein